MSFDKVFKKNVNDIRSMANTMISNGNQFCVLVIDPSTSSNVGEDSITYPSYEQINDFLSTLMTKELVHKKLPDKAIEEMKKKGQEPKKQPSEILICVIAPSETHVHMLIHNPFDHVNTKEFIDSVFDTMHANDLIRHTETIVTLKHDTPFKYSDEILRNVFVALKKIGVYKEEVDDDEPMNFDDF